MKKVKILQKCAPYFLMNLPKEIRSRLAKCQGNPKICPIQYKMWLCFTKHDRILNGIKH